MSKSLAGVFGGGKIDEDLYEELETVLLTSDMGIEATEHLLADVRRRVSLRGLSNADELRGAAFCPASGRTEDALGRG